MERNQLDLRFLALNSLSTLTKIQSSERSYSLMQPLAVLQLPILTFSTPEPQLCLEVVQVDAERNLLLVKGAVPGPNEGLLIIRDTCKA
jgi:hypothetical protein